MKSNYHRSSGRRRTAVLAAVMLGTAVLGTISAAAEGASAEVIAADSAGTYSLVQNVYSWGSSYSRVIICPDNAEEAADASVYSVVVSRYDTAGGLLGEGTRPVTGAYRSDAEGAAAADGEYVTLELEIIPSDSLASPYYTDPGSFKGQLKSWADCDYTITNTVTGETWSQPGEVYHPDEEGYTYSLYKDSEHEIPYASYEPASDGGSHPLIIWLHGAGSGGTDLRFVTGGMLVTNFITDEVQDIFGGAYVLLPQSETWWLDDGSEGHYTADGSSIYTESLMNLIRTYVKSHSEIDVNRIYVGGCSNGGYMTMALNISYPEYFAASFPVCEAYEDSWISDGDITLLSGTPTWFVHCANDPVVKVDITSVPTYERMKAYGAPELHYTTYESITDPDYGNEYNGHFSWVYVLKGLCTTDYDGSPVTIDGQEVSIFEWLAAQSK